MMLVIINVYGNGIIKYYQVFRMWQLHVRELTHSQIIYIHRNDNTLQIVTKKNPETQVV